MADADVQGLLVRIEATTAQFRQEMAKAETTVAQTTGKIGSNLGQVDAAFDRTGTNASVMQRAVSAAITGVGVASLAAVAGLVAITSKTADYAFEVRNLAALSNTSVTDFQRLAVGAKSVGVEQDKLSDIFKDTTDRVGEFVQRGGGEMADFFKEIAPLVGVTAQQFANLSGPDALQLYYTSLQKAGLSQAQVTTYMEAMADEATALVPLLKNNGEGFKTFGDQAERTGKILTGLQINRLIEVRQEIKNLETSAEGATNQLVLGMLPGIESVTQRLTTMGSNGALELIGSGIGFLVDHLNIVVALLGGKVAASFLTYTQQVLAGAVASSTARTANIAQAASAVEVAIANQTAATSATIRAEREAVAARGTAVQTQMSIALAQARMAERAATESVVVAQGGLKAASTGLLGLLGGPIGIAALAVSVGIAFLTMRDSTEKVISSLDAMHRPLEQIREDFKKLTHDQQQAELVKIIREQGAASEQANASYSGFLKTLRQKVGSDLGLRLAPEFDAARASGQQLSGVLDDVAKRFRLPPEALDSLKAAAGELATADVATAKLSNTVKALTADTKTGTVATDEGAVARAAAKKSGDEYLKTLDKQLATLQDKTAIEAAERLITESKIDTESKLAGQIRERAKAIDAQKAADKAATEQTKLGTSATKDAATEAKNRDKALTELTAKSKIETDAANGLAAAYFAGADKLRQYTLEQKVEEALLRTGAAARAEVTQALENEQAARDRQDLGKAYLDLQKETEQLLAQATATLQGADALDAYNDAKSVAAILAGKSADAYGVEVAQIREVVKANRDAAKAMELAGKVEGITDRLLPQSKLLRDYTADQDALNRAMETYPGKADLYREALVKLGQEYEDNQSQLTIWGRLTEGAIDRIDSAFADAWKNIGSGFDGFADNLKEGFKQLLAELAHEAITKPIMISFVNSILGTNKAGGIGEVLSGFFGSSSSGGSSSSTSGLGGMVQNLYSAYNAITGVGADMVAGWASGGVSGAASAGVNYYSALIGKVTGTVTTGLNTLVGAVTGSAATSTALITGATTAGTIATTAALSGLTAETAAAAVYTVGAEGITTAALSGAVAEGAATVGVNIGIAGATTAAASQGLMAQVSAALSSAAAMWPLAVLMGMYQSGKLYSAGVRPDAGEMWDSAGDTALGKVTMLPATAAAKYFEVTDKLLGKVVGGKMAAILSGSTLFQAVWSKVGSKLFGSGYQTKDTGLSLGVNDGALQALKYTKQKKKGGLISGSSKTRYLYDELDDEASDEIGNAYNAKIVGAMGMFSMLGVKLSTSVLDGLNMAATRISTQGKTNEAIQTELEAWFGKLGDSAVAAINTATSAGLDGYTFAGLNTFINNLIQVNTGFNLLNLKMLSMSVAGGKLAESLLVAVGGMEQFTANNAKYYDAFFSDTEKADDTLAAVNGQFKAMGYSLPGTRDGFRALVESLDTTSDAGIAAAMTLIKYSDVAASAYTIIEQRAKAATEAQAALAEAQAATNANYYSLFTTDAEKANDKLADITAQFAKLGVTLPGTKDGYKEMVYAASQAGASGKKLFDSLKDMAGNASDAYAIIAQQAETAKTAAIAGVTAALSAVQRAISAEQKRTTDAYNARVASLNDMASTAATNVQALTSISNSLDAALKQLRGTSDDAVQMLRNQAKATLQSALALARAGGSLSGFEGLEDALDTLGTNNTDLYGSMEAFARDQGQTANVIAELNGLNGKQLTAQQQAQASLQAQLDQAKLAYDQQMVQFDQQLAFAQSQLDAVTGVDTSVKSVAVAVAAMNAAVVAALGSLPRTGAGSAVANTPANNSAIVESLYQSVLGRSADAGGSAFWQAALNNGTISYDQLAGAIAQGALGNSAESAASQASAGHYLGIPGFAAGGMHAGGAHWVGERGPELRFDGPAKYYSASRSAAMVGSGDNTEMLQELRSLRQEVTDQRGYLRQISGNTGSTANHLDTIREVGLPAQEPA